MAALAHEGIDQHCRNIVQGTVDREGGLAELRKHLGGENIALEVLSRANSSEEVQDIFMDKYGTSWMLQRGSALVIGIVMFVFGFMLYFCKKCRCCAFERPTLEIQKNCVIIIIVITLVGLVYGSVSAINSFHTQQKGFQNARCTLAKFLDHAANGDPTQQDSFVGLFKLIGRLEVLEQTLDNGTAFDEASQSNILEETDTLNRAADLVNENLALLKDELTANKKPKFANNDPSLHDCVLCEAALPDVNNALTTMRNSIATLLGQTRAEVERSIQNGGQDAMKQNLKKTTDAVVAWKDLTMDGIRKMYKDNLFATLTKHEDILKWVLFAAVILVSMSALGLIVTAILSIYRFKYHEMNDVADDEEGQTNPYNKLIHQQARRTWCWAFVYVMFALIVAGTLNIVAAPLSSFCLVLHDLDGDRLEKIAPGLNLSLTGEQGTNWKEVMDKCVQPSSGDTVNNFLLDMLVTKHGSKTVSLKESLKQNARDVVQSRFSSVVQSSAGPAPPLLTDPVMQKLREVLKDNPVDSLVIGNRLEFAKAEEYTDLRHDDNTGKLRKPLGMDSAISQLGLGTVLNSSLACPNFTLTAKLGNFSQITIAGIKEFADRLAPLGDIDPNATDTCAKKVLCKPTTYWEKKVVRAYNLNQACLAGNRYMDLKRRLLTEDAFRCSLFTKPGGTEACDPKDMQKFFGAYTGDCMDAEGAVTVFERRCTLDAFSSYTQSWDDRLANVLKRADAEVERIRVSANVSLEQLIGVHIDSPIEALSGAATCNFLSSYFQKGIDGFCYQGIVGTRQIVKSYILCAVWSALLIPTMIGVYCRSKGNFENWKSDRTEFMELKRKQEEAVDSLLGKKKKEEAVFFLTDPDKSRVAPPVNPGPPRGGYNAADSSDSE